MEIQVAYTLLLHFWGFFGSENIKAGGMPFIKAGRKEISWPTTLSK